MKTDKYYVYIYLNPLKPGKFTYDTLSMSFLYEPFYIGKGIRNRYKKHLQDCILNKFDKNTFKINIIKKILRSFSKEDFELFIIFYDKNITSKYASDVEIKLIKNIGKRIDKKGPLVNMTDGGEGMKSVIPWNKGKKWEDSKKWLVGREPWNKGKTNKELLGEKRANEISQKISKVKTGIPNTNKGKKNPKISERNTIKLDIDVVNNIIDLYKNEYKGVPEIVKIVNLSRSVIERVLKENNIVIRTTRETKLLKWKNIEDEVIQLYKSGINKRQIGLMMKKRGLFTSMGPIENILKMN